MIRKELDPFEGFGKFELSGRKAEEQMAFYLRRFLVLVLMLTCLITCALT